LENDVEKALLPHDDGLGKTAADAGVWGIDPKDDRVDIDGIPGRNSGSPSEYPVWARGRKKLGARE
jgi:hypothetical protein